MAIVFTAPASAIAAGKLPMSPRLIIKRYEVVLDEELSLLTPQECIDKFPSIPEAVVMRHYHNGNLAAMMRELDQKKFITLFVKWVGKQTKQQS